MIEHITDYIMCNYKVIATYDYIQLSDILHNEQTGNVIKTKVAYLCGVRGSECYSKRACLFRHHTERPFGAAFLPQFGMTG